MGCSVTLGRWISRNVQFLRTLNTSCAGIFRSCRSPCNCKSAASQLMSTMSGGSSDESISPSRSPPWLMLPPFLEGGDMVYKFRSLGTEGIFSFDKGSRGGHGEGKLDEMAEVVGCSHGWVALFNRLNNDLFLSNPITGRHIKLPPIHTLPDPSLNLDLGGHGNVSKVVLSSSPDDQECHAMMIFGAADRLAFCSPGRSSEWTPIGDLFWFSNDRFVRYARCYEDLVYCSKRKVFTSITAAELDFEYQGICYRCFRLDRASVHFIEPRYHSEREDWDVQDPGSPKIVNVVTNCWKGKDNYGETRLWWERNMELLKEQCIQIPHLVYAEESDQLFLAMRFLMLMNPEDGSPLRYIPHCWAKGLSDVFPCKTVGFIVMEIDEDGRCTVVDDLNDLSMFVGINQSLAISAPHFPELKANSIYFTDAKRFRMVCGVNDSGIFNYPNKTCYDSRSLGWIDSSPIWFTPNR